MKNISVFIVVLILLLSACSPLKDIEGQTSNNSTSQIRQKIGGVSGNMMNNGLADGDGEIIVYTWENQLIKVNSNGTHRKVLNDDWVQNICIYGDWIYYRKIGATSDPINGIYKIRKDGSQRKQITSDTTQYIYVVGDWIYYVNWSYTTDICRIKTDGTNRETLYVGQFDCLSTDGENLYFVDFDKTVFIKSPMNGGAYEVIIPSVSGMPQVSNGWIYYHDGIDYKFYRIRTDGTGKEFYESIQSTDNFLATEEYNFFGLSRIDNDTGETFNFFTENDNDRWIAGNKILYKETIYDQNSNIKYQDPISITLFIKDIDGGEPILLERKTYSSLADTLTKEVD